MDAAAEATEGKREAPPCAAVGGPQRAALKGPPYEGTMTLVVSASGGTVTQRPRPVLRSPRTPAESAPAIAPETLDLRLWAATAQTSDARRRPCTAAPGR